MGKHSHQLEPDVPCLQLQLPDSRFLDRTVLPEGVSSAAILPVSSTEARGRRRESPGASDSQVRLLDILVAGHVGRLP